MNKKAFTLLELLVVVLIIGILAAIALPQYRMAVMKSQYFTMMNTVKAIYEAEQRYYLVHNEYSSTFDGLDIDLSGCTLSNNKKNCSYDWGICNINTNAGRAYCENNVQLKNAYAKYFNSLNICWAYTVDEDDKYNKLCQIVSGRKKGYLGQNEDRIVYQF